MKKSHSPTFSWRRSARLGLSIIALGSLFLFTRCGTEDLGFIDPFELSFADEFDAIVPPAIVEKEITVKTPAPSQVVVPERVGKIIVGLDKAVTKQDADKELEPVMPTFSQFIVQANPQILNTLRTLTANINQTTLNNLRSGSNTLNQDTKNLLATAKSFPSLAQFLAVLIPGNAGNRMTLENLEMQEKLDLVAENLRVADLVGPCRDAANEAWQEVINKLNQIRTTNTTTIDNNFNRRGTEIQNRNAQREAKIITDSDERWKVVFDLFEIYQKRIDLLDENQRLYLILFIYSLIDANISAVNLDRQIVNLLNQQEIAENNSIRTAALAALTTWYNTEKRKADTKLAELLVACHNQGNGG